MGGLGVSLSGMVYVRLWMVCTMYDYGKDVVCEYPYCRGCLVGEVTNVLCTINGFMYWWICMGLVG